MMMMMMMMTMMLMLGGGDNGDGGGGGGGGGVFCTVTEVIELMFSLLILLILLLLSFLLVVLIESAVVIGWAAMAMTMLPWEAATVLMIKDCRDDTWHPCHYAEVGCPQAAWWLTSLPSARSRPPGHWMAAAKALAPPLEPPQRMSVSSKASPLHWVSLLNFLEIIQYVLDDILFYTSNIFCESQQLCNMSSPHHKLRDRFI